jgi:SAM-dependent methyltransferase
MKALVDIVHPADVPFLDTSFINQPADIVADDPKKFRPARPESRELAAIKRGCTTVTMIPDRGNIERLPKAPQDYPRKRAPGSVLEWLKVRREAFLDKHSSADDWLAFSLSAGTLAQWRVSREPTRSLCSGTVLDAGSGRGAWKDIVRRSGAEYHSAEPAPRNNHSPTWRADICNMPQVPSDTYDAVICHQVLEHVTHPSAAMAEMRRVLKPGGAMVVSVPHLSRRHELPNDFFRFTPEGMAALARQAGLEVTELRTYGGPLSFLHHQASMLFPGIVSGIPLLGPLAILLNLPLSWCFVGLDRLLDRGALLPLGVVLVARKADGPGA